MIANKEQFRSELVQEMVSFLASYRAERGIETNWKTPLLGFADAKASYVHSLKTLISPTHFMPEDILPEAKIVISYFVPFEEAAGKTNLGGEKASFEWVRCYADTNAMFPEMNKHLIAYLQRKGYRAVSPETYGEIGTISPERIYSNWSQRHFAYLAGLGTFGMNNMLITERGICGRLYSLVTDLDLEADHPQQEEACLYKKNGSCGLCMKKCIASALSATEPFDRKNCKVKLEINRKEKGEPVCGKCVVGMPCTYRKP